MDDDVSSGVRLAAKHWNTVECGGVVVSRCLAVKEEPPVHREAETTENGPCGRKQLTIPTRFQVTNIDAVLAEIAEDVSQELSVRGDCGSGCDAGRGETRNRDFGEWFALPRSDADRDRGHTAQNGGDPEPPY